MKYLQNNKIKDVMIDSLKDKLDDYMDGSYYACDLAYELYESENADGCIFSYYTKDSEDFIKEHWDDLPEILEELKANFDKDYFSDLMIDIFDRPCRFVVVICLEVASYLLGQCEIIDKNWEDKIELTKENVDIIKKELEEMRD